MEGKSLGGVFGDDGVKPENIERNLDEEDRKENGVDNKYWFQRLLAIGLKIGLSKREILDDYYPGELELVLKEYNKLHENKDEKENSDPKAIEAAGF